MSSSSDPLDKDAARLFDLLEADIDVDRYLADLAKGREGPLPRVDDALDRETTVQPNGQPRQAGADVAEGLWIERFRLKMETSLFSFTKGVLARTYLTTALHRPICRFLQKCPPRRKLVLLPREHAKTSIVSHGLPLHLLIQSAELNRYFSGTPGDDCRILLACETEKRATDHLRVIRAAAEMNRKLRAFWPTRMWDAPRAQAPKWNDVELIFPRRTEYPDPSIRAIGVGGAVTGSHPTVLIKDDLISFDAANSATVMETAILWHRTSRALINNDQALEFIIGTRWAVSDLYAEILADPTVEHRVRAAVEDGHPIYPEMFSLPKLAQIRREQGVMFPLLYMNEASDPALTDFDMALIRDMGFDGEFVTFTEDARDMILQDAAGEARETPLKGAPDKLRGRRLNEDTWDLLTARDEYLRFKAG